MQSQAKLKWLITLASLLLLIHAAEANLQVLKLGKHAGMGSSPGGHYEWRSLGIVCECCDGAACTPASAAAACSSLRCLPWKFH